MPEKGVDRAVDIARRADLPLKIAAAVHPQRVCLVQAGSTSPIAFARGAVRELIEHGENGFLVRDVAEAVCRP